MEPVTSRSEEATVVERPEGSGDDTARTPPSGITMATASGLTGLGSSRTGVSTAAPMILRAEEHARTVALVRLVFAAGGAGLIAALLQERPSPGKWACVAIVGLTTAVAGWLMLRFRDPGRYDHRLALVFGLCCVASTLATAFYVGVFTPAIIAMYIGIYFFGMSDSARSGWTIYGTGASGYLALNIAALAGAIDMQAAVMPMRQPDPLATIAVTFVCQVLFAATFWMARQSRRATLAAFERLERAARQIQKRDALLNEAHAELDRERAAKLGRYTDQQVGQFTIGEVVGRGAMGEVYKGHDTEGDRPVAIKFLSPALTGDPASVDRFLREADVAGRLKSPHIVELIHHGLMEGGSPYLVMELLRGTDLGEQLREKQRLGTSAVLELVDEVAQALSVADEAGVVHRDLKPQNIYRAEIGNKRVWKVLDFGVSKILDSAENLTMGAAVGTPSYMAPEQARGSGIDHRADVFALSVVAYRALTGRPAFTAPDSVGTLYNVVHVQPVRPGDLIRIPEDMERVLALGLAKDAERRLGSALMLSASLRQAARGRLDERLRKDADALLAEHPWGSDATERRSKRSNRPKA
ncbi:MAG TPA: serine/threonine-protein kinase [Polyangiaceae bacterium]|nr:serine/threonine-protein kinase [Polyangiaceae bacterium]